jgi:hypothetical protein
MQELLNTQNSKVSSFSQLSSHEQNVLMPLVVGIMSHRNDKEKVFSNIKIRRVLKDFGQDINDMQIRKIVFHIRNNNIIPLLLANNEGYYIGTNIQQVNAWIETQEGKIEAMKLTLQNIKEQMSEKMTALVNGETNDLTGQMSIFDFIS